MLLVNWLKVRTKVSVESLCVLPFVKMIGRIVPKGWPQSTKQGEHICLSLVVVLRFKKMHQQIT
jgi:hypothetical protein